MTYKDQDIHTESQESSIHPHTVDNHHCDNIHTLEDGHHIRQHSLRLQASYKWDHMDTECWHQMRGLTGYYIVNDLHKGHIQINKPLDQEHIPRICCNLQSVLVEILAYPRMKQALEA